MKLKNKQGISLIVLVITIIVMVVLASAVIITLSNSGIINKASEATKLTNLNQVKNLANLAWTDAYLEGLRDDALRDKVLETLTNGGVNTDDYTIIVGNNGVTVQDGVSLNEYGFYYKQLYYGEFEGMGIGFIFYQDGTYEMCENVNMIAQGDASSLTIINATYDEVKDKKYYAYVGPMDVAQYSKNAIVTGMMGPMTVSEDGESLIPQDAGVDVELKRMPVSLKGIKKDIVYEMKDDESGQKSRISCRGRYCVFRRKSWTGISFRIGKYWCICRFRYATFGVRRWKTNIILGL